MTSTGVKYVSDADGNEIEVIVPISLWRAMTSSSGAAVSPERGLNNETTEDDRMNRSGGLPSLTFEEAGIEICEETGLPVFRMPVGSPQISTEFIRSLEDEW